MLVPTDAIIHCLIPKLNGTEFLLFQWQAPGVNFTDPYREEKRWREREGHHHVMDDKGGLYIHDVCDPTLLTHWTSLAAILMN